MPFELHVFHHPAKDHEVPTWAGVLNDKLDLSNKLLEKIMASIDNLKADLAALISEAVTDLEAAIAKAQAASNDPAIDALDAQVKDTTATLKADFAKLTGTPVATPPA